MEQEYGAPGAPLAQAARTVLPGEPFEPAPAPPLPGPRDAEQQQVPVAPAAPAGYPPPAPAAPQWTPDPAQTSYGAPAATYATGPGAAYGAPYPTAPTQQPLQQMQPGTAAGGYESLQDYALVPPAEAAPPAPPPAGIPSADEFLAAQTAVPPMQPQTQPYPQPQPQPQPQAQPYPQSQPQAQYQPSPPYPPQPAAPQYPGGAYPQAGAQHPQAGAQAHPAPPAPAPVGHPPAPAFLQAGYPQAAPAGHAAGWPPAPAQQFAPPSVPLTAGYPPSAPMAIPPLQPLAPEELEPEPETGRGRRRRATRSGGANKRLLALAAVVVLAAGGFYGYKEFTKSGSSSDATSAATGPVAAPVVPRYAFPTAISSYRLQTGAAATTAHRQIRTFALKEFPAFGRTASIASYGTGKPAIIVTAFHPRASALPGAYSALLGSVRKPQKGNVVGTFSAAAPGAAGGKMTCGGQRGAAPIAYCVWSGTSTVGMVSVSGSPDTTLAQNLTRELRAFAEH